MALKVDMDEWGVRYENERDGFGLSMHEHATHIDCHSVEVLEGEVVLFFDTTAMRLKAGESYREMDVAQRHGIWPIGRAVWYNRRNGPFPGFANMREDEKHTKLDARADLPRWARQLLRLD